MFEGSGCKEIYLNIPASPVELAKRSVTQISVKLSLLSIKTNLYNLNVSCLCSLFENIFNVFSFLTEILEDLRCKKIPGGVLWRPRGTQGCVCLSEFLVMVQFMIICSPRMRIYLIIWHELSQLQAEACVMPFLKDVAAVSKGFVMRGLGELVMKTSAASPSSSELQT